MSPPGQSSAAAVKRPAGRTGWLLWFITLGFLVALALFPASYRITRVATVVLSLSVWFGLIALGWRQPLLRILLLALTLLVGGFLVLPGRGTIDRDLLRQEYVRRLERYEGVKYYWGGESARGIDCSGLIRRGLIDALFWRGLRACDAGLVRRAFDLWWHDCSASALGESYNGLTTAVFQTTSINALDHARIVPGDLAVTTNGIHIMAYLGANRWIEADPLVSRVITVTAPSQENGWFDTPMRILRWTLLE
jgi:hypothetical protein